MTEIRYINEMRLNNKEQLSLESGISNLTWSKQQQEGPEALEPPRAQYKEGGRFLGKKKFRKIHEPIIHNRKKNAVQENECRDATKITKGKKKEGNKTKMGKDKDGEGGG